MKLIADEIKISPYDNYILVPFRDRAEVEKTIALGKVTVEIKKYHKSRSLDANAYMWTKCREIGKAVGNTDIGVYREMVRRGGVCVLFPLINAAVESHKRKWEGRGDGWLCDIMGDSKFDGYTNVKNFYGSSEYDTKEMSDLIDEVIFECKELGIETLTPHELEILKSNWKVKEKINEKI